MIYIAISNNLLTTKQNNMSDTNVRKLKASGLPRIKYPKESTTIDGDCLYGITLDMAIDEASRCLHCPKPRCVKGCPVNINIPDFITDIANGEIETAAKKLKMQSALSAVCGRVCPHEKQCEGNCILGMRFEPVAIGTLERFVADYARVHNYNVFPEKKPPTGKRVAVIGCGPAGITAAADLALAGHDVEIIEAENLPGGVLTYGIPNYRLPKEIVFYEVEQIKKLGVKINYGDKIGKTRNVGAVLKSGFDAIFIGAGVGVPLSLGIPNDQAEGVVPSNVFLAKYNMSVLDSSCEPIGKGAKNIVIVGGGNVAMDASRVALRLAEKSTVVYRRAREQMPARNVEIEDSIEEGVDFKFLSGIKRVIVDDSGKVKALECVKMKLLDADESGRAGVCEIENSEFQIPCDLIVVAVGNKPNPLLSITCPTLDTAQEGTIVVNPVTLQTSVPGVFAGGDAVTGALTVISAMGQAKKAARNITKYLNGEPLIDETTPAHI